MPGGDDIVMGDATSRGPELKFWYRVAWVVGGLSLLKGLRLPNRWAATQAQIDYSQGLVKRGFFGAAIANPLHLHKYSHFMVAAFVLLAGLLAMLVYLAKNSGLAERLGGVELLAVYFGSYSVSMLGNTVGYLDIPLAILATAILFVRRPMLRFVVGVLLTMIALMMHEMFLIVFVPVLLLSFIVQGMDDGRDRDRMKILMAGAVLALIAMLTTVKLALMPSLSKPQVATMATQIAAHTDFKPRAQFFEVMTRSARDNMHLMGYFRRQRFWQVFQVQSLLVFGPTVVLLLAGARAILKNSTVKAKGAVFVLAILCACSPLLMNVMGWDVARWNGLVCLTAFLCLLTVLRFTSGPALAMSVPRQRAAMLVLLFSMASGGMLMIKDDKPFPSILAFENLRHQLGKTSLVGLVNQFD